MINELGVVLISGMSNGAVYAMMAVGMALVYGVSKVFNFAYGSFYSLGGYLAFLLFASKFPYPLVFACAIPALFAIGLGTERLVLRPLRRKKDWEMLVVMSTLGLALFLDNLYLALFGPFVKALPPLFEAKLGFGAIVMSVQDIAVFFISIAIVIGVWLFLNRTRQGLAMQAVAQDMVGAEIVGIPKDRIFAYTFAISTVLVGLGGILLAPKYFVSNFGGWDILIKAWVITAFGGMGSIMGAVYAAFILGIIEALVGWQFGFTWTMVAWFTVLVIIFIVRPQGLLGRWG